MVNRLTRRQLDLNHARPLRTVVQEAVDARLDLEIAGDWDAVQAICGFGAPDFAGAALPLTAAAIQHFCRNHRDCDASFAGQFDMLGTQVPEALAIFYSIYHTQTRLDAEAALFLAQSSGSIRVARTMADLLAIGGFNNGDKSLHCEGRIYAIAAAFDTAPVIDAANQEARARLALPSEDREHLLQLGPDVIGLLAAHLADAHRLPPLAFFRKANLLAEARQDVNRFAPGERFAIALYEGDLPVSDAWVSRLINAMGQIVPHLVGNLPQRAPQDMQITA